MKKEITMNSLNKIYIEYNNIIYMKKQYVEKVFVYQYFDIEEFHQVQSMLRKEIFF
jgi:hypothetical protein